MKESNLKAKCNRSKEIFNIGLIEKAIDGKYLIYSENNLVQPFADARIIESSKIKDLKKENRELKEKIKKYKALFNDLDQAIELMDVKGIHCSKINNIYNKSQEIK